MDLEKMDLPEIKSLCKKYGISVVGDKKSLIKNLKYYLDPVTDSLNSHTGRKIPSDKKIVGVKTSEKDKLNSIIKNRGQFLYYSFGYQYYLVSKELVL
jgi:hypothetical protein